MAESRIGVLRTDAPQPTSAGAVVGVPLATDAYRFLRDHMLDGRAMLSTVMGVETMACAAMALRPTSAVRAVHDVVVGPPYFVGPDGRGRVEVTLAGDRRLRAQVLPAAAADRAAAPVVLFAAEVEVIESTALGVADRPPSPDVDPPVRLGPGDAPTASAEDIYALYFHGASFRVVGSAQVTSEVAVGRLASGLPPIADASRGSVVAPLLAELCLQTCGLWELAASGRRLIPHSVERIVRFTDADSDTPGLRAVARPRPPLDPLASLDPFEDHVMDAFVLDEEGSVQLSVQGYRTTPFPYPREGDDSAARRLRATLTGTQL